MDIKRLSNIIVGGGIAGLWLHAKLLHNGLNSYLITEDLGANQSQLSQGILHSGVKYTLDGHMSIASEQIKDMPSIWRDCLNGKGILDLSSVRVLTNNQLMVSQMSQSAKFFQFMASKALRSRVRKVSTLPPFSAKMLTYELNEPVLDTNSLIETLAKVGNIGEGKVIEVNPESGCLKLQNGQEFCAERIFLTCGGGLENLLEPNIIKVQKRPLKMLFISGSNLPTVYSHIVGTSMKPLATITSNGNGWYVGGQIAEEVHLSDDKVIHNSKVLLKSVFPFINFDELQYRIIWIERVEPRNNLFKRPDKPFSKVLGRVCIGLPVKLVFAPMLAEMIFQYSSKTFNQEVPNLPFPKFSKTL